MQAKMSNNVKYRRGGTQSKKPVSKNSALVTKTQVRDMLRSMVNNKLEFKNYDTVLDSSPNYGFIYCLTNIQQGVGQSRRVGNELEPSRLEIRWSTAAGDTTNIARFIVYQYMPSADSAAQSYSTILAATGANAVMSPLNYTIRSDYHILYDSGPRSVSAQGPALLTGSLDLTGKFKPIVFATDSTSTVAEGHIYLSILNDSGATPSPRFFAISRVFYNDA